MSNANRTQQQQRGDAMRIEGKLTALDLKVIEMALDLGADVSARCGRSSMAGTETVKVHSDGHGNWYLFGGYCMWWGLIQANSWEDAYYIYLEEFVTADDMPEDTPEGRAEAEHGTWDGNGNWYSEVTLCYIVSLDIGQFDEWDVELKPGDNYVR